MTDTDTDTAARTPITDVAEWMDSLTEDSHRTLLALGELLVGCAGRPTKSETAEAFTTRGLGVANLSGLVDEDRELNQVQGITVALALAELIEQHGAEVGPGEYEEPPAYTQTEIGDTVYRHPQCLRAAFPAGTLMAGAPCVIGINGRGNAIHEPDITAYVTHEHQGNAQQVLDAIMARANELNPYRGRVVRASLERGLKFCVVPVPGTLSRETVIVDETVWHEIDLGISAVRDHYRMLNAHGLGSRRGVLLVGDPGTGKSAVSAVVARELVGDFTVIYVEAHAGAELLTAVVALATDLGGPVLIILEDVDLWCRDRKTGGSGLSELLQAMDISPDAQILTLASTNDATTLDAAAIRTGRFDSIVTVDYPGRDAATRILSTLVADIPGEVDATAVATRVPERTSGSDLREIVRRAVLSGDGEVSTAALLAEIGSGRYKAAVPGQGQYL